MSPTGRSTPQAGKDAAGPQSTVCPLCGGANACRPAIDGAFGAPCWCQAETFPAELISQLPEELRGISCICRACLVAAARGK